MRLYYDEYTTRARSEALLIASDMLALTTAILFSTGASGAAREKPWDVALLIIWACIPRALAKGISWLDPPSYGYRTYTFSLGLVLLLAILIVAGWETLTTITPGKRGLELASALPIFLAWSSGLALFQPRAYLLFDFLVWAVMLSGLKDSRSQPYLWLPVFLGAILLSTTVRHLVHGVFRDEKRPPINLQNARASALLAVAASLAVFWSVYAMIHGGFDFPLKLPGEEPKTNPWLATSPSGSPGKEGAPPPESAGQAGATDPTPTASKTAGTGIPTVGFTYRVALKDLSLARFDPREILRVRGLDAAAKSWRPTATMHWKAVSFSTFNPDDDSWNEEAAFERQAWPAGGTLERELPLSLREADRIRLQCQFVTPVCRNIVQPYFTSLVQSQEFLSYRLSPLGDVFPQPVPERGTQYVVHAALRQAHAFPAKSSPGQQANSRHLEVPTARELGLDLGAHARRIFAGDGQDIAARVASLRKHFASNFKYSQNATWRAGKTPLATFFEQEKVGNCTYFATASALLLRAGGVSTRLAAGFLGAEWDAEREEAVLRNRTAHAWVEVYFPGEGWYPVDATFWVPLDPGFQAPPEDLERMREVSREIPRPEESLEAPEAPSRPPRLPPATAGVNRTDRSRPGDADPEGVVTDALPEGIESRDDFGGSWLELSPEATVVQTPREAHELAPLGARGGDFGEALTNEAGENNGEELAVVDDTPRSAFRLNPAQLQSIVRAAILGVGAVALGLLIVAFFRPRKVEAEQDDEDDAVPEAAASSPEAIWLGELDESIPRDRVLLEYSRLQAALERTRNHRQAHQTPLEHSRRVTRGRNDVEKAFGELHRTLYRLLYAGAEIDSAEAQAAVHQCRRLKKLLG